jgi:hypothetical protein
MRSREDVDDPRLPLFFTPSETSQAAGRAFLRRSKARTKDRKQDSGRTITAPQAKALITWCAAKDRDNSILSAINQPVLITRGE